MMLLNVSSDTLPSVWTSLIALAMSSWLPSTMLATFIPLLPDALAMPSSAPWIESEMLLKTPKSALPQPSM